MKMPRALGFEETECRVVLSGLLGDAVSFDAGMETTEDLRKTAIYSDYCVLDYMAQSTYGATLESYTENTTDGSEYLQQSNDGESNAPSRRTSWEYAYTSYRYL